MYIDDKKSQNEVGLCNTKKSYFTCELCKKTLSTKETLRRHILTFHIKLKPHVCNFCGKSFIFERSLLLHNEIHSTVPLYKCVCGEQFQRRLSFKNHYRQKHSHRATITCVYCSRTFQEKKQLTYHIQAKHKPCIFACSVSSCEKVFTTRNLLKQHSRSHSEAAFTCPVCRKVFKDEFYMKKHKDAHKDGNSFKCDHCPKAYLSSSHLRLHWRRAHSNTAATYLCCICGRIFKNKSDLDYHERAHQRESTFECELCGYKSQNKISFTNHKRSHIKSEKTKNIAINTEVLQLLRRETGNRSKKASHYVKSFLDSHPFKCTDCIKVFKTAVRANEHWRRTHQLKCEFKCSFCDRIFYDELKLVAHRETHRGKGGKDMFESTICDYKTALSIDTHVHNKRHMLPVESETLQRDSPGIFDLSQLELKEELEMSRIVTGSEINMSWSDELSSCSHVLLGKEKSGDENKVFEKGNRFAIQDTGSSEGRRKILRDSKRPMKTDSENGLSPLLSFWNDLECDSRSRDIFHEESPPEVSINEETIEPHLPQSNYFYSTLSKRKNPKITLNCTAIDSPTEEDILLKVSNHFL